MSAAASTAAWSARPTPAGDPGPVRPASLDGEWRPLRQAWLGSPAPDPVNPGWTRARWTPEELRFDVIFRGQGARNRATRLNDRTWELGDIAEVFLLVPGASTYLELHVTPENQRLQLRWPFGGLERLRAGTSPLGEFTVDDPGWIHSHAEVGRDDWAARITVPAAVTGSRAFATGQSFRAAVCRYDCTAGAEPRLSSTAALTAPDYHRHPEWDTLLLA